MRQFVLRPFIRSCFYSSLWFLVLVCFCEYALYYLVLLRCTWPVLNNTSLDPYFVSTSSSRPLRVMLLADPHLLGSIKGHWLDKIRREWQMERSFQTAMFLHQPDVVFILGDILDEGQWASEADYSAQVNRYNRIFRHNPAKTIMKNVVGNHDIGFHYAIHPRNYYRFQRTFTDRADTSGVRLWSHSGINFVMLNSMAFEGDECNMCAEAERSLSNVSRFLECTRFTLPDCDQFANVGLEDPNLTDLTSSQLADFFDADSEPLKRGVYSAPILLQHFPLYRTPANHCPELADMKTAIYRPRFDCMSETATRKLLRLRPRLVISGHSHRSCKVWHIADDETKHRVLEWTVSSFSWRNVHTPSFLLMRVLPDDFAINECFLPNEIAVICVYVIGCLLILLLVLNPKFRPTNLWRWRARRRN